MEYFFKRRAVEAAVNGIECGEDMLGCEDAGGGEGRDLIIEIPRFSIKSPLKLLLSGFINNPPLHF